MKQYMKYVKPYALYFLLAPILMLVEVVGEVFMPKFLANIINIGIPEKNSAYIIAMGFAMAGMAIVMMLGGVGVAVSGVIVVMAIYMIVQGTRKLKRLKTEEQDGK